MIKDKVLAILRELGFQPELINEVLGYKFEIDGLDILFQPQDEDARTLYFILPCVHDVTDNNRIATLEAMAKLTGSVKFIQPVIFADSVWLNYQHYLGESEPTSDVIEHMLIVLSYSLVEFKKIINNEDDDE